jgi:UDP-glucose:(heptosyl)LPS alpha-1,3-glucosyltransferase
MRLALLLYKYFPYGGMQRDFRRLVEELQRRGHHCRVYFIEWEGDPLPGAELRRVRVRATTHHRRNERFLARVQKDLAADPVDGVIGFNRLPGLDVYFAADPCYLDKALTARSRLYRRGGRFRHFAAAERAVFGPDSNTHILLISETERAKFERHYQTSPERMHLLPPGVSPDRRRPEDAASRRRALRENLGVEPQDYVLLFLGSGFVTKGLDRAIRSVARVRGEQPSISPRLLVVGRDKRRTFHHMARRLGVGDITTFLGGRDDVPDLLLAADVLVHPALVEAGGTVLLEALVAGLPVVTTDACGYAHHIEAGRAGIVLPSPFSQDALDRAVLRMLDGVYRAECRRSGLLYAELTDLYSMHSAGARLIEQLIGQKSGPAR